MKNYYEVLEVKNFAEMEVIKAAYKALAKKYHPDINPDADEQIMVEINNAFDVLSNPDTKTEYDFLLKKHLDEQQSFKKEQNIVNENREKDYIKYDRGKLIQGTTNIIRNILSIIVCAILSFIVGQILYRALDVDGSWTFLFSFVIAGAIVGVICIKIANEVYDITRVIYVLLWIIGITIPFYQTIFETFAQASEEVDLLSQFIYGTQEIFKFFFLSGWIRAIGIFISFATVGYQE